MGSGTVEEDSPCSSSGSRDSSRSSLLSAQHAIQARAMHPTGSFVEFPLSATETSLSARFAAQVDAAGDRLAIRDGPRRLTYEALDRAANRLAHALLAIGGARAEPVPLLFGRELEAIVGLLGVVKAGKFYVPLDIAAPPARLAAIVDDLEPRILVTSGGGLEPARALGRPDLAILAVDADRGRWPDDDPGVPVGAGDLASVLYTSGSTGRPKGVVECHRGVLHHVMRVTNAIHVCPDDRQSLLRSFTFTGAIRDILTALLNGASVHLRDLDRTGIHRLGPWLAGERITIYRSVVSVFRQFAAGLAGDERFPDLRIVSIGGEPILRRDLELFQRLGHASAVFVGMLAATEAGMFCQYLADRDTALDDPVLPAGYPMADMEIQVLDGDSRPAAPGEAGEIVVRSRYVAEGYWRRPGPTAAAFRPDPGDPRARRYHTGDLGLRRPDGALVHRGRQDLQVKVRGHRVEPAEVEAAVLEVSGIQQAAVTLREAEPGVSHLVAYVVPEAGPGPTARQLRQALAHRLPEVMLPTLVVTVAALPRTATGKVDRRRLPEPAPGRPLPPATLVPPRTPLEAQLAAIWRDALGLDSIGVHDHLLDLGGHSVLAARIAARVSAVLGVALLPSALLEHPTVADLAAALLADQDRAPGAGR